MNESQQHNEADDPVRIGNPTREPIGSPLSSKDAIGETMYYLQGCRWILYFITLFNHGSEDQIRQRPW